MKRSLPSQIPSKDSFRSLRRWRCLILENAKRHLCEMRLDRGGSFPGWRRLCAPYVPARRARDLNEMAPCVSFITPGGHILWCNDGRAGEAGEMDLIRWGVEAYDGHSGWGEEPVSGDKVPRLSLPYVAHNPPWLSAVPVYLYTQRSVTFVRLAGTIKLVCLSPSYVQVVCSK